MPLYVTVVEARGLGLAGNFYCSVDFGNNERRTKTSENSENPKFANTSTFDDNIVDRMQGSYDLRVKILLEEGGQRSRQDRCMGEGSIDIVDFIASGETADEWFDLAPGPNSKATEIRIRLRICRTRPSSLRVKIAQIRNFSRVLSIGCRLTYGDETVGCPLLPRTITADELAVRLPSFIFKQRSSDDTLYIVFYNGETQKVIGHVVMDLNELLSSSMERSCWFDIEESAKVLSTPRASVGHMPQVFISVRRLGAVRLMARRSTAGLVRQFQEADEALKDYENENEEAGKGEYEVEKFEAMDVNDLAGDLFPTRVAKEEKDRETKAIDAMLGEYGSIMKEKVLSQPKERRKPVAGVDGFTQLHEAASEGDLASLQVIVASVKNIDAVDESLCTALHHAAQNGHLDCFRLLAESGANVNARSRGEFTPLHLASRGGHYDVVLLAVRSGADVHATTARHASPLHLCCRDGHIRVAELLLGLGSDVNAQSNFGWTPLHIAASEGHLQMAELVLRFGGKLESLSNEKSTPLMLACRAPHVKMVEYLVEAGSTIGIVPEDNRESIIHWASENGRVDILDLLSRAKRFSQEIDAKDQTGNTALHRAIATGQIEAAIWLVKNGASQYIKNGDAVSQYKLAIKKWRESDPVSYVRFRRARHPLTVVDHGGLITFDEKSIETVLRTVMVDMMHSLPNDPIGHMASYMRELASMHEGVDTEEASLFNNVKK